jgi:hypothetical protein
VVHRFGLPTTAGRDDGHPLAMGRIPPNGRLNSALRRGGRPIHKSQVRLADFSPLECFLQEGLGVSVLGYEDNPGSILVQAMNDPRPFNLTQRLDLRGMGQDGGHQGPGTVACRRVDHKPSRFVDHQDILIFEKDFERNRLRLNLARRRGRYPDLDSVSRLDNEGLS